MAGLRVRVLLGAAVRAGWAGDGLRARAAGLSCWAPPRRFVLPGSDARTLCSAPGDLGGRQVSLPPAPRGPWEPGTPIFGAPDLWDPRLQIPRTPIFGTPILRRRDPRDP